MENARIKTRHAGDGQFLGVGGGAHEREIGDVGVGDGEIDIARVDEPWILYRTARDNGYHGETSGIFGHEVRDALANWIEGAAHAGGSHEKFGFLLAEHRRRDERHDQSD